MTTTPVRDTVLDAFGLTGRAAVVTGAASGIGRETALVFARAGADVALADRDAVGLEDTARLVRDAGHTALVCPTDVTVRAEVEALADAALAAFGRLDVWANVAGVLRYFSLAEAEEAQVRTIIDVNQLGVYWGTAAAGRRMAAAGRGSIVNVASTGGELGVPGLSGYGMTKAAVLHLTRTAAAELGPAGVRCNAVAPGFVETPMVALHYTDSEGRVDTDARERLLTQRASGAPLQTTGTPRDIALAMLYLASDAAAFTTGQTLRPNGGVTMS
ncbi:SDR family NAD(P)-dependent oxidoreductase [Pseudonocardia pini]|uniref:SDR family NAD(P)-dependent oxidoreductase n=1 Tax=Pseudonocardia pini TaxID=2758030 RepID=UPI0015F04236|nr:SDR family oxidoreductase [Pseudonocardia pini]